MQSKLLIFIVKSIKCSRCYKISNPIMIITEILFDLTKHSTYVLLV